MGLERARRGVRGLVTLLRRRPSSDDAPGAPTEITVEPVDAAAAARRRLERSRFADDAAYFEFLVERAVRSGSTSS